MDFAKLCAERYSLRKFDTRPVEREKLDLILEAGRNAPTAHNKQPQRIFVLQSAEALEKADACMGCHFHPPVIIAVGYDPAVSWRRIWALALRMWDCLSRRRCWRPSRRWRAYNSRRCCRWAIRRRGHIPPSSTPSGSRWRNW